MQEKRNQSAELHDDNPWMIGRMLQFFYQGSYDYKHYPGQSLFPSPFEIQKQQPQSGSGLTLLMVMSRAISNTHAILQKTADAQLVEMEIDAAMYIVADKYGAAKLKTYVLEKFKGRYARYDMLIKICQGDFRNLIDGSEELKAIVAEKVALYYKDLREKESDWLQNWLSSDPLFALLIMDRMKGIEWPSKAVDIAVDSGTSLPITPQPVQANTPIPSRPASSQSLFSGPPPVQNNTPAPSVPASNRSFFSEPLPVQNSAPTPSVPASSQSLFGGTPFNFGVPAAGPTST